MSKEERNLVNAELCKLEFQKHCPIFSLPFIRLSFLYFFNKLLISPFKNCVLQIIVHSTLNFHLHYYPQVSSYTTLALMTDYVILTLKYVVTKPNLHTKTSNPIYLLLINDYFKLSVKKCKLIICLQM